MKTPGDRSPATIPACRNPENSACTNASAPLAPSSSTSQQPTTTATTAAAAAAAAAVISSPSTAQEATTPQTSRLQSVMSASSAAAPTPSSPKLASVSPSSQGRRPPSDPGMHQWMAPKAVAAGSGGSVRTSISSIGMGTTASSFGTVERPSSTLRPVPSEVQGSPVRLLVTSATASASGPPSPSGEPNPLPSSASSSTATSSSSASSSSSSSSTPLSNNSSSGNRSRPSLEEGGGPGSNRSVSAGAGGGSIKSSNSTSSLGSVSSGVSTTASNAYQLRRTPPDSLSPFAHTIASDSAETIISSNSSNLNSYQFPAHPSLLDDDKRFGPDAAISSGSASRKDTKSLLQILGLKKKKDKDDSPTGEISKDDDFLRTLSESKSSSSIRPSTKSLTGKLTPASSNGSQRSKVVRKSSNEKETEITNDPSSREVVLTPTKSGSESLDASARPGKADYYLPLADALGPAAADASMPQPPGSDGTSGASNAGVTAKTWIHAPNFDAPESWRVITDDTDSSEPIEEGTIRYQAFRRIQRIASVSSLSDSTYQFMLEPSATASSSSDAKPVMTTSITAAAAAALAATTAPTSTPTTMSTAAITGSTYAAATGSGSKSVPISIPGTPASSTLTHPPSASSASSVHSSPSSMAMLSSSPTSTLERSRTSSVSPSMTASSAQGGKKSETSPLLLPIAAGTTTLSNSSPYKSGGETTNSTTSQIDLESLLSFNIKRLKRGNSVSVKISEPLPIAHASVPSETVPAQKAAIDEFRLRVHMRDGRFGHVRVGKDITCRELLQSVLPKKFFVKDGTQVYQLFLSLRGIERPLAPEGYPVLLQNQFLQQVGCSDMEDLRIGGHDDYSYFFKFIYSRQTSRSFERKVVTYDMDKSEMSLVNHKLDAVPVAIHSGANRIVSLDLSLNPSVSVMPSDLFECCVALQHLRLSYNDIRKFPFTVFSAKCLKKLDLSHNYIDLSEENDHVLYEPPRSLREPKHPTLLDLHLRNNHLTTFFSETARFFSLLQALVFLDLSGNHFKEFPRSVCKLFSLKALDLSHNDIKEIPSEIGKMTSLKSLTLAGNQLTSLPAEMAKLVALSALDLRRNQITSLEPVMSLDSLMHLKVAENNINIIEGGHLKRLEHFDMHSNKPLRLEPQLKMPHLTFLDLSGADLAVFPQCLVDIPRLKTLHLDNNHITALPEALQQMTALRVFSMKNNGLKQLPAGIRLLQNLETLDLHTNNLTVVPPEIWYLCHLRILNLSSNHLQALPPPPENFLSRKRSSSASNKEVRLASQAAVAESLATSAAAGAAWAFSHSSSTLPHMDEKHGTSAVAERGSSTVAIHRVIEKTTSTPSSSSALSDLFSSSRRNESRAHSRSTSPVRLRATTMPDSTGMSITAPNAFAAPSNHRPSELSSSSSSSSLVSSSFSSSSASSDQSSSPVFLADSLQELYLGDNNLKNDVFETLLCMRELRRLNLAMNDIDDFNIPDVVKDEDSKEKKPYLASLQELNLSENHLRLLPDAIKNLRNLTHVYLNSNKLVSISAELNKANKLTVLDLSNNNLRYNLSNWQRDFNWNWSVDLRVLDISGNPSFIIKNEAEHGKPTENMRKQGPQTIGGPSAADKSGAGMSNGSGADKNSNVMSTFDLRNLRRLDLMDVTYFIPIPDETDNKRIRTSPARFNKLNYAISENFYSSDAASLWDLVIPSFWQSDDSKHIEESFFCLFDGRDRPEVARFAYDKFGKCFKECVHGFKSSDPLSAIRRAFLSFNLEIHSQLGEIGQTAGASALMAYIVLSAEGNEVFIANIGDAEAVISRNRQVLRVTKRHVATAPEELKRIQRAGGYINADGNIYICDMQTDISRSFGNLKLFPFVNADPHIERIKLTNEDSFLIMASAELWKYVNYQTAVNIAYENAERPNMAAARLRNIAMAYGARGDIMVMVISFHELFGAKKEKGTLKKSQKANFRDPSLALMPLEVEPPVGKVALIFTDIKNSTLLWETEPEAMKTAIFLHNSVMRQLLRKIGGYEVKTEGDAFMVSFQNVAEAVRWCCEVQMQLLTIDWPKAILEARDGRPVYATARIQDGSSDPAAAANNGTSATTTTAPAITASNKNSGAKGSAAELNGTGTLIYRGLSVRMGIHLGEPVQEMDPVTHRMDYFGPIVNRAARICGAADGGQIFVSSEVHRDFMESIPSQASEIEFIELGERKLKGLENPEVLYLYYPKSLIQREPSKQAAVTLTVGSQSDLNKQSTAEAGSSEEGGMKSESLDLDSLNGLGEVLSRLEALAAAGGTDGQRGSSLTLPYRISETTSSTEYAQILASIVERIENASLAIQIGRSASGIREALMQLGYISSSEPKALSDVDLMGKVALALSSLAAGTRR